MQGIIARVAAGLVGLTGFALGAVAADAPAKVCARYVESLKQADRTLAVSLSAHFPKMTTDSIRGLTTEVAAALRSQPMTILLESSKILGDCAVVIGKQSVIDLDPVFMLKQNGQWRVLPTITSYEHSAYDLSQDQLKRFQELEAWFKEKKAENYAKLNRQNRSTDEPGKLDTKHGQAAPTKKEGFEVDRQATLDVNAVVAAVAPDKTDAVAHFLVYCTSGVKGNSVIATVIAKGELNKIAVAITITTTALAAPPSFLLAE
jgi:hypothetical protein